jgi:lipoprotein NlpD
MKSSLLLAALAVLLAGCSMTRPPAPVDDRRPAPSAQKPAAVAAVQPGARTGTYVVKRGDTLYSIALETGVDYRELARWNNLDDASRIRVGQELRTTAPDDRAAPGVQVGSVHPSGELESRPLGQAAPGAGAPGAAAPPAADGAMKTSPRALRLPYSEQNLAALQKAETAKPPVAAAPTTTPAPAPAPAAPAERAADAIDFIWPAKGRVVAGFSEPRNKGVDIAGNLGDPVVAAAAGKVIYVGSGIPGLGKFIVVRHDNGFNTVYAHNRENLVKMDQNIARGQKIAEIGNSDADTPKLHFQIRKFGTPLDPLRYLPPA